MRKRRTRPARTAPVSARFALAVVAGLLALTGAALPGAGRAEELWSVHAYGLKVGELRLAMEEEAGGYRGASLFRTTGIAGLLRRIRFDIRAEGRREGAGWRPLRYSGDIHTGRRQSRMALDFSGPVPLRTAGEDAPAVPIAEQALAGAIDPMTMAWLTLGARRQDPCAFDQTQFDGTRLTAIRFERGEEAEGMRICHGVYDRLGGYSAEELAEITRSPLSIRYRPTASGWQAVRLDIRTRHGPATLHRRD
ncbi:DUF3108 domain-containing protein [Shimia sp.]|uniref:DUF3108 domain-containing protein n=1 Tax=Shimia sp. TaxID=1954381 RepID=UPI00356826BD